MDGYTAEARAGDILNSAGIDESYHFGLMKEVAPGKKVRVLLAQALFAEPDILLLDEPTNNLDIYTISWLAEELNKRKSTMLIISHDRHFLNSVCTTWPISTTVNCAFIRVTTTTTFKLPCWFKGNFMQRMLRSQRKLKSYRAS